MNVHRLPVLRDNYIFVLHCPLMGIAAVVDPAEAEPVLDCVSSLGAQLVAIFNTHHHWDHIGGNLRLWQAFPNLMIYGSKQDEGRIPGQSVFLADGDSIDFGERVALTISVPGHTDGHIAYYFPPVQPVQGGELFCGDTLFAGGCGRLFEGTPEEMVHSLDKLRRLPDETRVWCAHEYTLNNLRFAVTVDPHNSELYSRLRVVESARAQSQPTIPSHLGVEKRTNPFLRWDSPDLSCQFSGHDPIRTFAKLRGMKDQF